MRAYERFLKYVKYHTTSDGDSGTHPSAEREFTLARALCEELCGIGCDNAYVSDNCYVYAKIPATKGYEAAPKIGFIAHIDTAPDFSGENVNPQLIENYNGEDIPLSDSGRVLSPKNFPSLKTLVGRTLITTDGKTLLGADDKAGVAEIMTAIEKIIKEGIPHGGISVAFTPDEEIGEGATLFDVAGFGADFAYTVDGGAEGSLEYENFNAASADFTVNGLNVHPGSAKDTMINASLVAMEINSMLPEYETPSHTDGYLGFYHLTDMKGNVERATLSYIVRDHDRDIYEKRKETLREIEAKINKKYGTGTAILTLKDSYRNMKEKILPCMHLVETATEAARLAGAEPVTEPIRGGTDGARLSFMGLPCPNLGTGGYAFHGPYEHISAEGMDIATEIILNIIKIYSKKQL